MDVASGNKPNPLDETKEFVSVAAQRASMFLCYAPDDAPAARKICQVFEQRGMPCWFSERDQKPTLPWPDCINEAIESSSFFLVLLTARSANSTAVTPEIQKALDCDRSMVVLQLGEFDLAPSMEYQMRSAHWLTKGDEIDDAIIESLWTKVIELETGVTIQQDGSLDLESLAVDPVAATSILVKLTALHGKISGKTTYRLRERERLMIGRGSEVDIDVADTRVSRRHAGIAVKRDATYGLELRVVDLMSTNGTWIRYIRDDDSEFSKFLEHGETRITNGAIIRVGSTDIQVSAVPIPKSTLAYTEGS